MMNALGFCPKNSSVVVKILEVGSLSQILFNRRIVGSFSVKRSIRQGCLLAPLLFTMCLHPMAIALEAEATACNIEGMDVQDE